MICSFRSWAMILTLLPVLFLALPCPVPSAQAGQLSESEMAGLIVPPMSLGARDAALPIWTLLNGGGEPMGYVFETVDLAPLPGFSGVPINMLVSMDRDGRLLQIRVLSQSEPVFVDGLGPEPLHQFVRQYAGKSISTPVKVAVPGEAVARDGSANVYVDGVAKATASTGIINQTILAAALKVARERLAGAAPKASAPPDRTRLDILDWAGLVDRGLVQRLRLTAGQVGMAFGDRPAAADDDVFMDVWVADLGVPSVAQSLLTPEALRQVAAHVRDHEEPILLLANGGHSLTGENFVRNGVPDRLFLRQDNFPLGLRDADVDITLRPGLPTFAQALVLRVDMRLGFDPSTPWDLAVRVVRQTGLFMGTSQAQDFSLTYRPVAGYYQAVVDMDEQPPWRASWTGRMWQIAVLLVFLAGLTVLLIRQNWLVSRPGRLGWVRAGVLAVTLGFIGWYGQGQLSIVTVLALVHGHGLGSLLYDPFSLILWVYVLAVAVFWGRGPFCGWLCPFGALQEMAAWAGRRLGIREKRLSPRLNRWLSWVKYGVLAILVLLAAWGSPWADRVVEIEPFKTAITLGFDRHWPFAVYALALLAAGMVVYKLFCRFLCPLGAAMAVLGRLRRLDHIPRRRECGQPCQLCAVRCRYGAITARGRLDYDECVQCLDCLAIYHDARRCVPQVVAAKRAGERS